MAKPNGDEPADEVLPVTGAIQMEGGRLAVEAFAAEGIRLELRGTMLLESELPPLHLALNLHDWLPYLQAAGYFVSGALASGAIGEMGAMPVRAVTVTLKHIVRGYRSLQSQTDRRIVGTMNLPTPGGDRRYWLPMEELEMATNDILRDVGLEVSLPGDDQRHWIAGGWVGMGTYEYQREASLREATRRQGDGRIMVPSAATRRALRDLQSLFDGLLPAFRSCGESGSDMIIKLPRGATREIIVRAVDVIQRTLPNSSVGITQNGIFVSDSLVSDR